MAKKPNLSDLPIGNRLAAKPFVVSSMPPADAIIEEKAPPKPRDASRDFKTVMARMNRAGWAELRRLSVDMDRPTEDLLIEALNDLLARHGRPAIIEKRRRPDE